MCLIQRDQMKWKSIARDRAIVACCVSVKVVAKGSSMYASLSVSINLPCFIRSAGSDKACLAVGKQASRLALHSHRDTAILKLCNGRFRSTRLEKWLLAAQSKFLSSCTYVTSILYGRNSVKSCGCEHRSQRNFVASVLKVCKY
jgi:hypothetical protein